MNEDDPDGGPSDWFQKQSMFSIMGRVPSQEQAPIGVENEADYWRGRFMEAEKTIMQLSRQMKDIQFHQGSALMREDTTAEDILGRIWHRGVEALGAIALIFFILQVVNNGISNLTLLGQFAGAFTFLAVYEAYLRPHINS